MDKMGLRGIESTLPPGFRFYPSDEELVCHYLYNKVANIQVTSQATMVEVDLHTREPWELPDVAKLSANEWYFFSFRDRKYATGSRTNRATKSGYWKATGKDKSICEARTHAVVGMRKTLVFYRGRAPHGIKTAWVMHEFRLHTPHSPPKEDWVLCKVFNKMRKGDDDTTASSSLAVDLPVKQDTECYSTTLMQMQQQPRDEDRCSKLDVGSALLNMEALLLMNPALVEENLGSDYKLGFLQATMDDVMGFQEQQQQIMGEEMVRFQFPRWQG